jgi:pimeloyl-ACP methyl ester carboxylesterase
MDHLAIREAVVGGISMGAAITLNFALRHPDRVLGLVQSRPAWLDAPNPWNVTMFSLVTDLVRRYGREEGKQRFLRNVRNTRKRWRSGRTSRTRWPDSSTTRWWTRRRSSSSGSSVMRRVRDRLDWMRDPSADADPRESLSIRSIPTITRWRCSGSFRAAEFQEITAKSVSVEQHNADVQQALDSFSASALSWSGRPSVRPCDGGATLSPEKQ